MIAHKKFLALLFVYYNFQREFKKNSCISILLYLFSQDVFWGGTVGRFPYDTLKLRSVLLKNFSFLYILALKCPENYTPCCLQIKLKVL